LAKQGELVAESTWVETLAPLRCAISGRCRREAGKEGVVAGIRRSKERSNQQPFALAAISRPGLVIRSTPKSLPPSSQDVAC
jgi:hypothetical protein